MNQEKLNYLHLTLLGCLLSVSAHAEYPKNSLGFSFNIDHSRSDWQSSVGRSLSKQSRLGISWEETLAPRLKGGVRLGYVDLSQPDATLSAARVTTGEYIGLHFTGLLIDADRFSLDAYLDYSYHNTKGEENTDSVEIIWYQSELGTRLNWHLFDYTSIIIGGNYMLTDGELRLSGTNSQLTEFEQADKTGYSVGLAYQTETTGVVSVSWQGGNRDGVHIYFSRRF